MSCFFMTRIVRAWEKANDPDFIPEETAAMSVARIANSVDPHATVLIARQSLKANARVWQHAINPSYRSRVESLDDRMLNMADMMLLTIEGMGVSVLQEEGMESDDLASRVAMDLVQAGGRVSLVSNSLRLLPLLDFGVSIRAPFSGRRSKSWCRRKYGMDSSQMADYLALVGCGRFAGVPQIGPKRAAEALRVWGSIEAIVSLPRCEDRVLNIIKDHAYTALTNKVIALPVSHLDTNN
jgi:5'-3' exonuclease